MSALAEARLTANRQAIAAMAKPYIAGTIGPDDVAERLNAMGERDAIDAAELLAAWDVLREYGAPAPAATKSETNPETEPATDAQMRYLAKLADERGTTAPDYKPTKAQASTIIEQLKAGTYNPDEWTVPF